LGPSKKLSLALSKGHNRAGVSLPSPEDGNRSSFQNVVFSSYLELHTMEKSRNSAILNDNKRSSSINDTELLKMTDYRLLKKNFAQLIYLN
jgi:hypothetical protein